MALSIRLSRGGAKKRPYYRIVVADSRSPRDGRFIEKLGAYQPQLPKDHEGRLSFDKERVSYWLSKGAQPTDRVSRFLEKEGMVEPKTRANMQKAQPGKKALERLEEKKQKEEAAAEAADAASADADTPAEDAAAE